MLKVNIQHFGGRGQGTGTGGAGGRYRGGGSANITESEVFGESKEYKGMQHEAVRQGLDIMSNINEEYNLNGAVMNEAKFDDGGVLGCCDYAGNVSLATGIMDIERSNNIYDVCVKEGFHPSRGNQTGFQAVAWHEWGHSVVDQTAAKMNLNGGGMELATRIVKEARSELKERGVVIMASKISRYATTNNHETVAEAFSDVKCNGDKANAVSKKVVEVLNRYAKAAQ